MKSKNFRNINYNKWRKNVGDCVIRAIVGALGLDYEIACKLMKVDCKKEIGFTGDDGIDLYDLEKTFKKWLGPIEELLPNEDNPLKFDGECHQTNGQMNIEEMEKSIQSMLMIGKMVDILCM